MRWALRRVSCHVPSVSRTSMWVVGEPLACSCSMQASSAGEGMVRHVSWTAALVDPAAEDQRVCMAGVAAWGSGQLVRQCRLQASCGRCSTAGHQWHGARQSWCIRFGASDLMHQGVCIRACASGRVHQGVCIRACASGRVHQGVCIRACAQCCWECACTC
jgi:hypothetical protein